MNINKKITTGVVAVVGLAAFAVVPYIANAAPTAGSTLTQEITSGALSTDIRDAGGNVINNPSFAMSQVTLSNSQQESTGLFGSGTERITVDNPGGADGGWTLDLNVANPGTEQWVSGSDDYEYNGTVANGQLTVDPEAGTLTAIVGTTTGVTKGVEATFSGSTPITLLTADASSDNIWNGYIMNIALTQTIPASQPAGNYSIDMVQTVAAT